MSLDQAVRSVDLLLALWVVIAYTVVMSCRQRNHTYSGYSQLWRYLGVWSFAVVAATVQLRGLSEHRPLNYVTWMLTLALAVNVVAGIMSLRELYNHVTQVDQQNQ